MLLLLLQVLHGVDARVQHRALQLLADLVHGNKALRQQALQVRLAAIHRLYITVGAAPAEQMQGL